MNGAFKWCFIGTGRLANQVAAQITASGWHEIVSVHGHSLEKGEAFARQYGGVAYDDAAKAIAADGVQAVYIVTPHDSHGEFVRLAVSLGKSVLCEKPFTTDARIAEELLSLAQEKGVYVAEAMWTWFAPVANQVKRWLDAGAFGEVREAYASYCASCSRSSVRLFDPNRAGGALLDIGVYPLTYLYRLFGMPVRIACEGVVEDGVDMEEEVDLTFENGGTYRVAVSIRDGSAGEKLRIVGSEASLEIDKFHNASRAELVKRDGGVERFCGDGSFLNEFDRVAEEIRAGLRESAFVPHRATIDVMRIMDECRRQMNLVYPFEKK